MTATRCSVAGSTVTRSRGHGDVLGAPPRRPDGSVFRNPLSNNPPLAVGVATALLLHVGAMYLPLMQRVLAVGPITADEWIFFPAVALSLLVVMELHKLGWKWRQRDGDPRRLLPAT